MEDVTSQASPRANTLLDELLDYVEKGRVIPILGPALHTVRVGDREVPVQDYLAEHLVPLLEVPRDRLPTAFTIDDVVAAYLDQRKPIERVYRWIHTLLGEVKTAPPQPLRDLASIAGFRLFVTTAFDDLLARAVSEERGETEVLGYSGNEASDLARPIQELETPVVYHLFGKVSAMANQYAVTEEDTLEFMCALQTAGRRPPRLFDALRERHLLLIGCNFSDWLARFFIRTARNIRPSTQIDGMEYFADPRTTQDQGFVVFLKRFSRHTELITAANAAQFAADLAAAWRARRATPEPGAGDEADEAMSDGAVFISYPSESGDAAQRIRRQLRELGIRAWLDREKLEGGDDYAQKIHDNVDRCGYFLAVISEHTQTEDKRWFRREWQWALEGAEQLDPSDRFIVPVGIDDTDHTAKRLPHNFRAVQWLRAPRGEFTADQKTELKRMFGKAMRTLPKA